MRVCRGQLVFTTEEGYPFLHIEIVRWEAAAPVPGSLRRAAFCINCEPVAKDILSRIGVDFSPRK